MAPFNYGDKRFPQKSKCPFSGSDANGHFLYVLDGGMGFS